MPNWLKLKKAITDTLQEKIEIIDSKIDITEELDGFIRPVAIRFGHKDTQLITENIIRKLKGKK